MRLKLAACLVLFSVQFSSAQLPKAPPPFAEVVAGAFARWDLNTDGELSLDEVNRAVVNPDVKGAEAAAVAALRRGIRSAKDGLPKLTLAELKAEASAKGGTAKYPDWNTLYHSAYDRIAGVTRELFANGTPTLESVSQGRMGDCFCLAPLGAICHREPADIVAMIRPKPDGSFEVKIGSEWVAVPAPTDAELALSGKAREDGIWVNVYEKAVGAWKLQKLPANERPVTALDVLAKGGSAVTMLASVTGHPIDRVSLAAFKGEKAAAAERERLLKEVRGKLERAFAEKRCVTTGTGATLDVKTPNINTNHAYAVLGYDKETDRLLVWTPHGQTFKPKGAEGLAEGYVTTNGQFRIPLSEFARLFAGLAFELKKG